MSRPKKLAIERVVSYRTADDLTWPSRAMAQNHVDNVQRLAMVLRDAHVELALLDLKAFLKAQKLTPFVEPIARRAFQDCLCRRVRTASPSASPLEPIGVETGDDRLAEFDHLIVALAQKVRAAARGHELVVRERIANSLAQSLRESLYGPSLSS